ncbi:MAG TPA: hypothetical protein VFV68_06530 [Agriterribacter sp.]|nr:hypothetical protein [Agriterribacter sp.]
MVNYPKHIIAALLLTAFLFKGLSSIFSLPATSNISELFTDTEKESTVKKVVEKEFFNNSQCTGPWHNTTPTFAVEYKTHKQSNRWQNPFIPVATPPPNLV